MASDPPQVNFQSDGLALGPAEYAARLAQTVKNSHVRADADSTGGIVDEVEHLFATALGKEAGLFLPTGTMANHLALKALAGSGRVLVQADSHIYNDSGEGAVRRYGVDITPLAMGRRQFELADVEAWVARTKTSVVANQVTAISIESPIRRHRHQMVDFEVIKAISGFARANGIKMHMDGARMFNLPHHSGRSLRDYAQHFDTVYVCLRKLLNGMSGAVLVGDQETLAPLRIERKRSGGSLSRAWPLIALVPESFRTYDQTYAKAWEAADAFIAIVEKDPRLEIQRVEFGTSVFLLRLKGVDPQSLAAKLTQANIVLAPFDKTAAEFPMRVNGTLLSQPPAEVAQAFLAAL